MANTSKKKQDNEKDGPNAMTAAVKGAVIGAGIAIVGAVALKEENRKKMKDAVSNTMEKAEGYINDLPKKANEVKEAVEDEVAETKEDLKNAKEAAKKSMKSSKKSKA